MKRRRTRRRTWRRTRRRCGGLGGIGGIRSGNRIVPTRKAISGGGGIGSSIRGTTQTAAASRIVMEASTKIGTSMHEGQQQRRRSCRGGQKSGGVDDDISSSSHQRWRCGRGGGKSGGVDGDIRIARRRSSGKRWRLTWRSTRRRTRRHRASLPMPSPLALHPRAGQPAPQCPPRPSPPAGRALPR